MAAARLVIGRAVCLPEDPRSDDGLVARLAVQRSALAELHVECVGHLFREHAVRQAPVLPGLPVPGRRHLRAGRVEPRGRPATVRRSPATPVTSASSQLYATSPSSVAGVTILSCSPPEPVGVKFRLFLFSNCPEQQVNRRQR
uniref:hypothetical protein n=1 Tax=Burkholderia anthina TaxID=179879 RepID=UPI00158B50B5|nr:hypothetical protein [Burkholderia anthina]